ncbi:MFS transporter [Halocynthiibacter sp. C4]|uniref:MFS transporter n=1 Tax=Halocynthiibacter sp. C4 TaxID=2992758 RepID=UPI00237B8FE2|nr:MFS transporter [Halocynthiibacter sp. C4]MDE0590734.1 MFS transporter [Halocynthiibacter sp. C4]
MSRAECIALYVALTALTAFAIDGVLPVMPAIDAELSAGLPFSVGQIITAFVLGMAVGELAIGPISDAVGRRPSVIAGLAIFVIGSVLAAIATSFEALILGRFLQGVGVAGPKIGTRAMIRDQFEGADMAKVMSMIFTLLVFVPMIAPALGAALAAITGWRGVLWGYLVLAAILGTWLWARHPETHPKVNRVPLKLRPLLRNFAIVVRRRDVFPIIVATGFVFGGQLAYFAVAAELFGEFYGIQSQMPALIALLATGMGAALMLNVRFVGQTGLERPIWIGLLLMGGAGGALLIAALGFDGQPPLGLLLALAWVAFFALGLLFGNLGALAMRPLGELAGLGSSLIASVSSVVAFIFATVIESTVNGPVWTIAWGFTLAAVASAILFRYALAPTNAQN